MGFHGLLQDSFTFLLILIILLIYYGLLLRYLLEYRCINLRSLLTIPVRIIKRVYPIFFRPNKFLIEFYVSLVSG
jgi:hypothetical protein